MYLTTRQTTKALGISRATLHTYVKEGLLKKYKIGKRPVYYIPEIEKLKNPAEAK